MLIVVVVDISEKTDDFNKTTLTSWQIFTDYYLGFIPRMMAMLFPLFVFISVIFFTSKMAERSEIIAILSSGVSYARFTVPYFVGAGILAFTLWFSSQSIIPNANYKWSNFEKRYIDVNQAAGLFNSSYRQHVHMRIDSSTYLSIRGYDTITRSGTGFLIQKFADNKLLYNLRAATFKWDTAKNNWQLTKAYERFFNEVNEAVKHSEQLNVSYPVRPIDLRKDDYLKDQMTTRDLDDFIQKERFRNSEYLSSLLVERYNRDAQPAAIIILTIIGVSMSSRKVRGGSGAHLAIGVVLSVLYILFSRFSHVFATKSNFSPMLAAWTPNILFGLIAIYLYYRASK